MGVVEGDIAVSLSGGGLAEGAVVRLRPEDLTVQGVDDPANTVDVTFAPDELTSTGSPRDQTVHVTVTGVPRGAEVSLTMVPSLPQDGPIVIETERMGEIKGKKEDDNKEWPFPGFSRQLLGVSSGDSLDLTHQFPDDETVDEDYRGVRV